MPAGGLCIRDLSMLTIILCIRRVGGCSATSMTQAHRPSISRIGKPASPTTTKPRLRAMACLEMLRSGFTMFIEPGSLFSTQAGAEAVERVGLRALFRPALSLGQARVL